jgi:hypothetical protein
MHHSSTNIMLALGDQPQTPASIVLNLGDGDTAWNPASTRDLILGPCQVTYTEHADGGVHAIEQEVPQRAPKGRRRG